MKNEWKQSMDPRLISTHYAEEYERYYNAVVPPIFMNSLHVFNTIDEYYDADRTDPHLFIYGRAGNPTVRILEQKIAALEHGIGCTFFASGMAAATTAILSICKTGSHVVCIRNAYGPVRTFLEQTCVTRLGMKLTYVKENDISEFEEAITDQTDLVILESPSSAVMSLQDIPAVVNIAHKHHAKTYIDNSYCTPIFQIPLDMGVDIVMHTASKYLGGHSDIIGGALIVRDEELYHKIVGFDRELLGGIIGPMEAWLVMRGLRTLEVRMERHFQTAMQVSQYLEKHPRIKKVYYPFLESSEQYSLAKAQQKGTGGLMSFEIDGSAEQAKHVVNNLNLFKIGVSWGGFESLVYMPCLRMNESQLAFHGAGNQLTRIHCGLEGADYIMEDLEQALSKL